MLIPPGAKTSPVTMSVKHRPAPTKGMNTADMVTALEAGYAQRLDNFVCNTDGLHVRNGYTVTETKGSAVTALLAAPGAVVAMTDGDWIGDVVANPGGRHLIAAKDGGTTPRRWTGSAWTDCTITGVAASSLVCPVVHGRRLWFIERDTLNLWYLGVDAIGGPARPVYCGPMCRQGGSLTAIASLTGDGGKGGADRLVAVTSLGELLIYSGNDPDSKDSWSHAGTYAVAAPVGRRCFAKMGASAALLTAEGAYLIPKVLAAAESGQAPDAITENVAPSVAPLAPVAIVESRSAGLTVVHGTTGNQLIRSGDTLGWSRFVGLGATVWLEAHDGLYFGRSDGKVCRYAGYEDGDGPIASVMVDSFSALGSKARKSLRRCRPHFKLAHPYRARVEALVDYREPPATWAATYTVSNYWMWPEITWEIQPEQWSKPITQRLGPWRGLRGSGHAVAAIIGMSTRDHDVTFIGMDYAYETGGAL